MMSRKIDAFQKLFAVNPALDRSIRYRAGLADKRVQRGIHTWIHGIAEGLRNTG
jgi:phosphoenolpyruvate carboxylase